MPPPSFGATRAGRSWWLWVVVLAMLVADPRALRAQTTPAPFGTAADYGLLAGGSIQAAGPLPVAGRVGAAQSISPTITATQTVTANNNGPVPQALADAQAARAWCGSRSGPLALADLHSRQLAPGTYALAGSVAVAPGDAVTLTGDSASVYVFNVAGSMAVQARGWLRPGRVMPGHIYWHIRDNLTVATGADGAGMWLPDGGATFAGEFSGPVAVLAGGAVQVGPRDAASGYFGLASARQLLAPAAQRAVCPAATGCNLVRNGSFESGDCSTTGRWADFDGYPGTGSSTSADSRVGCWLGYGSPDWYTSTSGCAGVVGSVPVNIRNQRNTGTVGTAARTGAAYAGIYARDASVAGSNQDEREYVLQPLDQPLEANHPYYAEYYASIAPASRGALARLQVAFATALPAKPTGLAAGPVLGAAAATVVASTGSLPTTVGAGWTRVGGSFTPPAGSSYQVMILGNFGVGDVNGAGPDSQGNYGARTPLNGAYYYVEDVSLTPFPSAGPATVQVGCAGTVQLGTCPLPAGAEAAYQWQPTAGLDNPTAPNPTAKLPAGSPSVTYTLFVRAGGQTYVTQTMLTSSNYIACVCPHPYKAVTTTPNAYQAPAGNQPWELGEAIYRSYSSPARPVPIDGKGGTVVFEGIYHLLSPVELLNGTFEVRPGTVFYADGGQQWGGSGLFSGCYQTNVLDNTLQLWVGQDATLQAAGTTFTATCDAQWGGIELRDNGALVLRADPASGQRCVISQARVGVQLGTACGARFDGNCLVSGTDFVNDLYGVSSEGFPSRRDPAANGITDCTFTSDVTAMLPPYLYYQQSIPSYTYAGIVLHGPWHDGIAYRNNRFESVYVGIEVAGGTDDLTIANNQFRNAYGAAIQVAGGAYTNYTPAPLGNLTLADNTIEVPADANPGSPVYGIQVLPLPLGGKGLFIEGNQISSPSGSNNPAKPQVGLDLQMSFDGHYVQRQNQFVGLDQGVRLLDASGATTREEWVTDNLFAKNGQAVAITGQQYAPFAPVISCNTMENGSVGILVEASATVGRLSGPPGGPGPFGVEPVANRYDGLAVDVQNDGVNPIDYYASISPFESVNGSGTTLTFYRTSGTPCEQRPAYGPGKYGLNRPAAGAGITAQQARQWEEQLAGGTGTTAADQQLTALKLIAYREDNQQWGQLESFANTLPLVNDAAFDELSLYLLERYRRLGQPADAQRVRKHLLTQRPGDVGIGQRVSYFDVSGRVQQLLPSSKPTAADSAALGQAAGGTSGFAPVACALLRYYYPELGCQSAGASVTRPVVIGTNQRSASHNEATTRLPLVMFPNPAYTELTVQLGAAMANAGRIELTDLTGRVALRQPVVNGAAPVLRVAGLPAGVYIGRVLDAEGRVLGTTRIAVAH